MLSDLQLQAEVAGVHRLRSVRNGLDEASAAVRYAKGLGLLTPDVFRPAVNTAMQKLTVGGWMGGGGLGGGGSLGKEEWAVGEAGCADCVGVVVWLWCGDRRCASW
jgi:hypothetical protein